MTPTNYSHNHMLGPFTWRYGTEAMRAVWSEAYKRKLWRRVWVALAEVQQAAGLVSAEQVNDLRAHQDHIDIERALAIESEIRHDLMAEVRTFAEQCPVGGGIIHLGATSTDIEDNADALRIRESLDLLLVILRRILLLLVGLVDRQADHACLGYTHLQPAEPTTIGYRLAAYAQDLYADWLDLQRIRSEVRGKGFKGAVGTSASYTQILHDHDMTPAQMEQRIMGVLGLPAYPVATQTYTRRQDWIVISALAGLGITLHKFALDLRILQSPLFGEWSEPFGARQVGSSAMPFKRNPVNAENVDSLTRYLASLPPVAWNNAALSILERTLDDSANRRIMLPEAFLAAEEALLRTERLMSGLEIDEDGVRRNLETYGLFSATERVLMQAVRGGGDRQELHEIIREHSMAAWELLREGSPNPLIDALAADERITSCVPADQVRELMRVEGYVGDAPARARALAEQIRAALEQPASQAEK